MRTRLTIAFFVAAVAFPAAQNQQDRAQTPTFRSGANYVRVDMYATRDGQAIHDLQLSDLELLEDGVPQTIEDFEHVLVREPGTAPPVNEPVGLRASREAAADPRARVFVIFLDTYHTQTAGSTIMRDPLVRFLDRVLGPDDLVALMTPEMAGSDIALGRKTAVMADIISEEWWGKRARTLPQDPKELMYERCVAALRAMSNSLPGGGLSLNEERRLLAEMIARRREKLALEALEDLMTHLAGLRDERKAIVLVTEGWLLYKPSERLPELAAAARGGAPVSPPVFLPPVLPPSERDTYPREEDFECQADLQTLAAHDGELSMRGVMDEANRGNVTFYPVYARGLAVFDAPIGPDPPPTLMEDARNLRTRHESLRTLAVETDGEAIINTNNVAAGLKRIADDLSSYYLLGYYSTNTKLDGRYRTITVRVKRPGVRVRARRGYRARTAEEVAAVAAAPGERVSPAVMRALNTVAGGSARSAFKVRPAVWIKDDGPSVWVVGELDVTVRRDPAWVKGGHAEIVLLAADGSSVGRAERQLAAGEAAFSVRVPTTAPLAPGDYAARVRLRGAADAGDLSETTRVTISGPPNPLGEAVLWRRGTATGPRYVRTADPRFQRSDRLRLEHASDAAKATAQLLDRHGKPLQVPIQVSERVDTDDGTRWIVADATLAPLAPGDYLIEVAAGGGTQVTAFRVVP